MMHDYFLLNNRTSRQLYRVVKDLPVIDYHNHLSLQDIKEDKRFTDVYDLWIKPDPYKHRAMRMCGVRENDITGDASREEKFVKWCETLPMLIGNPLYHWSLMELKTVFHVSDIPDKENALAIYRKCNQYLADNIVSVNRLLDDFHVEYACPCASLIDDISFFENSARFSPSLRGDDMVNLTVAFVEKLGEITQTEITDLEAFKRAVCQRLDDFQRCGCVFSDHALDNGFVFSEDDGRNADRFVSLLKQNLDDGDKRRLSAHLLTFLGEEYAKRRFVMQLHIGAERYTSTRLRNAVGPAGGFAGIGNSVNVSSLTAFLDRLDCAEYGLPKTVLFTLNPADNALMSVLSGSYSKDGAKGLVTQGPAWWWCDHTLGIEEVLENAAAFSALSNFIGMTTDSRSFLSFVRHDYFRRILCRWVGDKMGSGDFVCRREQAEELIYRLCYANAKEVC